MVEADSAAFGEAMGVLGETFNEPVSPVRIEAYFAALEDLDTAPVLAAMRHTLKTCRFFPRPAEIRQLVLGDGSDKADGAWGDVLHAIRTVGYLRFPVFEDERIMPAIRDVWGNWERLCSTLPADGPELVGWIKQFKGAYQSAGRRVEQAQIAAGVPPEIQRRLADIATMKAMK